MSNEKTGEIVAQKVQILCESRGLTIKRLESEVGFSNGYIRKLRLGQSPSIDNLNKIANFFDVTTDFLTGAVPSFNKANSGSGAIIPIYSKFRNGHMDEIIGEEVIPARLTELGEYFAWSMNDDSMAPNIENGDRLIVRAGGDVINGQPALVFCMGRVLCRILMTYPNYVMLIPQNREYIPDVFDIEELYSENIRLLGAIHEIRRCV